MRYTLTIADDGKFRTVAVDREFVGHVQVSEGWFRWKSKTTGLSGTLTLYEGEGKRILQGRGDDGRVRSPYTPAERALETTSPISKIKDGKLCTRWPKLRQGAETCSTLYKTGEWEVAYFLPDGPGAGVFIDFD
jgi:hypothetical protein